MKARQQLEIYARSIKDQKSRDAVICQIHRLMAVLNILENFG